MKTKHKRMDAINEAMTIYRDKDSIYYEDEKHFELLYNNAWTKYLNAI